MFYQPFICDDK